MFEQSEVEHLNKGSMDIRKIVYTALFIALGIVFPIAFHSFGASGKIFLPMHIPVLMAGLLLGARSGLIAGVVTPVLSSLMTGMPPLMPTTPIMAAELGTYGLLSGYLHHNRRLSLTIALVAALVGGRIAAALTVAVLAVAVGIKLSPTVYIIGALTTGLPGIIIQLVFIPLLVKKLKNAMRW